MATRDRALRLFVAAYPPLEVSRALLESLAALRLPSHRVSPAEQVHLTLQFVGDTAPGELDHVTESVRRSASGLGPFDLHVRSLLPLPRRSAARLVAAETDAPPALLELVRRLGSRLGTTPRKDAADRFRPHLTLCRFPAPVALESGAETPLDVEPFSINHVALMRSVLAAAGARHYLVERVALDGR